MMALTLTPDQHTRTQTATEPLRRWYMVVDGNGHQTGLCPSQLGFQRSPMLSEALLPQIRALACLMAAGRHDFDQASPAQFTEEADWFAARILVLGVRVFHLDVSLLPMLKLANQRAQQFALSHGLAFVPAQMQMSLHAGRPANLLIIETASGCGSSDDLGMVGNTLAVRAGLNPLLGLEQGRKVSS